MTTDREISIVMAVYNGERFLRLQLESIIGQQNVLIKELIIVDDCSTDQSLEIIGGFASKYDFIHFFSNQKNLGPVGSFKEGAKLAKANYVAFADQDDFWLPDKLSLSLNLLKQIDSEGKPSIVFTDLTTIDETGSLLDTSFWKLYGIEPQKNDFYTILFGNIATGCSMVLNRPMLTEFIKMPTTAQMHDHWLMLIASSWGNWGYYDKATVLYRVHGKSVTNKDKITFQKKMLNFLTASFSKNPDFLSGSIEQAILFQSIYQDRLDSWQNKRLAYFISLKRSSGFMRKIHSKFRFIFSRWS